MGYLLSENFACNKCNEKNNYFFDKTSGLCTINCNDGFYFETSTQKCNICLEF